MTTPTKARAAKRVQKRKPANTRTEPEKGSSRVSEGVLICEALEETTADAMMAMGRLVSGGYTSMAAANAVVDALDSVDPMGAMSVQVAERFRVLSERSKTILDALG